MSRQSRYGDHGVVVDDEAERRRKLNAATVEGLVAAGLILVIP